MLPIMDMARTANESLWEASSPGTAYPPLEDGVAAEVAVVGGGITGLTTAYLLARAGVSVVLLEARAIALGTTGHTTAKVTALHGVTYSELIDRHGEGKATVYAEANQAAVERIAAIAAEHGIECDLRRLTAYAYAQLPEHLADIEAEVAAANRAGLPVRLETNLPLPFPTAGAVALDEQVLFHPRRYCLGLAEALVAAGGTIHEQSRVESIEQQNDGFIVGTSAGSVNARWVVQATLLPINDRAGLFAQTEPSRSYAVATPVDDPEPWGMFLSVETPHRSLRPHKLQNGRSYLIIEGEEHRTGADTAADQHFVALEDWARENIPGVSSFDYRWSAQDYFPADGIPFVGQLNNSPERMLVATGFKKWGMSNGTAAAMMLSDLIMGRPNPWLEVFDARRPALTRGLVEVAKSNLDVARHFVGDRLARVPGVEDLGPGQGSVVDVDGTRCAVYRDEAGNLVALSARCTHMGCLVGFNPAERSWDCPCHGSRFGLEGHVLEGPAVEPLKPVELPQD